MDYDAIRTLARDCARHCIAHNRCGNKLACTGAPHYLGCLEQMLGGPPRKLEEYEFRMAFEAAAAMERREALA